MATVDDVLAEERKMTRIDIPLMSEFLYGAEAVKTVRAGLQIEKETHDFNIFNKSRVDILKKSFQEWPEAWNKGFLNGQHTISVYLLRRYIQSPGSVHRVMFLKSIELMGTVRQCKEYIPKGLTCQIVGCYAQTELGHGSDVRELETTATYDISTKEYIVDTPTISATKYWPGDLGITSTHALVLAQLIVNGKKHGIHSFIVPIRDTKTYQPLPNIEVGDIGPKIGYAGKDNGYLIMHKVRIPRKNMLRRFTSVSQKGEIKIKGDPKVSYATMMTIRQAISCYMPRIYSQAIAIAARYSLFRRQFMDKFSQEVRIIDYQAQKEKIIPRVAEYYAVTVGGLHIKEISDENLLRVKDKNDFSLMNQSHVCLCIGKALFSQTCYEGMQICRRACGGHGFSHYSGFPSLLSEFSANLTYEGENTVLYLQVSRFLLKCYKQSLTKKKPLGETVKYIDSYDHFMEKRIDQDRTDPLRWTNEDIRTVLAQSVCYLISRITSKMINKAENMSELDIWNGAAGVDIKRLGLAHSFFYVFNNFKQAAEQEKNEINREVLISLCLLYGTHVVLSSCGAIWEAGFLSPAHLTALMRLKELLMDQLRPHLIGLIDAFDLPQFVIRSDLAHGDPYQNMLESARKCEINASISESAWTIRHNIVQAIARHQVSPKL